MSGVIVHHYVCKTCYHWLLLALLAAVEGSNLGEGGPYAVFFGKHINPKRQAMAHRGHRIQTLKRG